MVIISTAGHAISAVVSRKQLNCLYAKIYEAVEKKFASKENLKLFQCPDGFHLHGLNYVRKYELIPCREGEKPNFNTIIRMDFEPDI